MESRIHDKRLEKGDETCTKILSSAMEVISLDGVSGISAAKLSSLSQISKSSIFYHFKSIQEIPEAVLQLIFSRLLQPLEGKEEEDLGAFLHRLGSSFMTHIEEDVKLYKSFFSFYHESIFHESYRAHMEHFLKLSKENLTSKICMLSEHQISDPEAGQAAALIIAALDGMGMHILLGGDKNEYLDAWNYQIKLICSTVKPLT